MRTRVVRPPGAAARRTIAALAILAATTGAGCATKGDIRTLQQDIRAMQLRQDSLFRESQRQTRLLLDTLRTSFAIQQDVRGETSHRFQQLEQNLAQLEAMINQSQILMTQLTERLDRIAAQSPSMGMTSGGAPQQPGQVQEMYDAAMGRIQVSPEAARVILEQIVAEHPNDPLAPEAQFQLAGLYDRQRDYDRAIAEYEKLERLWQQSPRAAEALLRAGVIAQDRRQNQKARDLYDAILQRHAGTPAADEAARRRASIRG